MTNSDRGGGMKYRVLIDYGTYEGMKFWSDKGYDTVDEAVKVAMTSAAGSEFYIVKVIKWIAKTTR